MLRNRDFNLYARRVNVLCTILYVGLCRTYQENGTKTRFVLIVTPIELSE